MKNYKFIGTEQDLIDNGYQKSFGGYIKLNLYHIIRIATNGSNAVYCIDSNDGPLSKDLKDATVYIKDLIDKGLVVEDD